MKINISRHYIYIISLSILLFVFVLFFAFSILIPEGKEYRIKRAKFNKEQKELKQYQRFSDETYDMLKNMQSENRHIITAFDTIFDIERFEREHKEHFKTLTIQKLESAKPQEGFSLYEVNTSSKISTPTNFYTFLDAINKSNWIIGVNFPIIFKREGELINSSFTMRVYFNNSESNETASASVDK